MSNTSPLTNLAAINRFERLRQRYGELVIAKGIGHELNAYRQTWLGHDEVATAGWTERRSVVNTPLVEALRRDPDPGEAETIALALELKADLVLMDEREGRHAAQRLGLATLGVVGVLLDGKRRGFLRAARPAFDALRTAGFYLGEPVYRRGRGLAGERDDA